MQELLGRIARLDPSASLGLRVIACFDELIVGNVNTRALLSAAASLAGCTAGFEQDSPTRRARVTPRGQLLTAADAARPVSDEVSWPVATAEGLSVWLEREGDALPNDAIILERLALAVRIRHGRARSTADQRRDLALLVDGDVPVEDRLAAAGALGLNGSREYRIVAAPLFAVWENHPSGPEDVVPTVHGPIHVLVLSEGDGLELVRASPAGTGVAALPRELHHSFRTAMVSLRLCDPPRLPSVRADEFGGLIRLLADAPEGGHHPDADRLDDLAGHLWAAETFEAVIRSQSIRSAARLAGVHHSTMQARVDTITGALGFDPFDGFGKPRLGTAYLVWRLRRSRVLDLPAPPAPGAAPA